MAMLSQRAVDYAIKGYALNSLELSRKVIAMHGDVVELELCIRNRGRDILASGAVFDLHSENACSQLRIFSSFRTVFTAATEIAQNLTVLSAREREVTFPRTAAAGESVNRLVRQCSVALFEQQRTIAETVFQIEGGRRGVDLALCCARLDLLRYSHTDCGCELAIANCIGQIADQVYEIAESTIAWLGTNGCTVSAPAYVAPAGRHRHDRLPSDQFAVCNP